jgi:hypothetical protein
MRLEADGVSGRCGGYWVPATYRYVPTKANADLVGGVMRNR